jgi:hypothetical protein
MKGPKLLLNKNYVAGGKGAGLPNFMTAAKMFVAQVSFLVNWAPIENSCY